MGFLDRLLGREKKETSESAADETMGQEGMHQPAQGMADTGADRAEGMADTGAEKAEGMAGDARTEAAEHGIERENP
jgi:hypothetical protein